MIKQCFYLFLVLVSTGNSVSCYAQVEKKDTVFVRRYYPAYPDIFTSKWGIDSLDRHQGYWKESLIDHSDLMGNGLIMNLANYYLNKNFNKARISKDFYTLLEEEFKTFGLYKDGKREGLWRIYFRNILFAQVIFVEDTILMVIGYKEGRIYAIERSKISMVHFENDYMNTVGEPAIKERIVFDRKGRIREHMYVGDDGLFKRYLYCSGREIDGYILENSINYEKKGFCKKVIRKGDRLSKKISRMLDEKN